MDEPYDYLREVEQAVRNDPLSKVQGVELPDIPFSELQETQRDKLLTILIAALSVPHGAIRKSAAFALGQVGDDREEVLSALRVRLNEENAKGNKEAIVAALTTLGSVPRSSGSTELERRRAVENAYFGRPLDSESSPYSYEPASKSSSGCFSVVMAAMAVSALASFIVSL